MTWLRARHGSAWSLMSALSREDASSRFWPCSTPWHSSVHVGGVLAVARPPADKSRLVKMWSFRRVFATVSPGAARPPIPSQCSSYLFVYFHIFSSSCMSRRTFGIVPHLIVSSRIFQFVLTYVLLCSACFRMFRCLFYTCACYLRA